MELVFFLIILVFGANSTENQDKGMLYDRARLRKNTDKNQDDFFKAVRAGRLDVVKSLIEKVDLTGTDKYGCTTIHVAAYKGHKDIIKFLADKIDLNQADKYGCTPVHVATSESRTEILKFLAKKVDLNRPNKYGCTPVYWAARQGHMEIVEFFADRVDLNKANNNGNTPIDIATMKGHTKIVKFLIEKKVKLYERLLQFAATEEIKQIIAQKFKHQNDFLEAVWEGRLEDVQFLAEKVDVNRVDRWGRAAIHVASEKGHKEIVEYLADRVDLNQEDKIGDTPVHVAARHGRTEIVRFFIEKNVKLEESLLKIAATEEIQRMIAEALTQ